MGVLAVALAAVNVFGGFLVTRRMLEMFKKKDKKAARGQGGGPLTMSMNVVTLLYLIASVCFIQALKGLSPSHHLDPRQPLRHGRHGHRHPDHRGADRAALGRQGAGHGLGAAGPGGGRRLRRLPRQDGRDDPDARTGGLLPQHDRPGGRVHRGGGGGRALGLRHHAGAGGGGCRRQHARGRATSSTASCATPFPRATGSSCSWVRPSAPSPSAAR